jgi:hypothetical protein
LHPSLSRDCCATVREQNTNIRLYIGREVETELHKPVKLAIQLHRIPSSTLLSPQAPYPLSSLPHALPVALAMSILSILLFLCALPFSMAAFGHRQVVFRPTTAAPSATALASGFGYSYVGCWNETTGYKSNGGARALSGGKDVRIDIPCVEDKC